MNKQTIEPSPETDTNPLAETAKAVKVYSYRCKIAYPMEAAHIERKTALACGVAKRLAKNSSTSPENSSWEQKSSEVF